MEKGFKAFQKGQELSNSDQFRSWFRSRLDRSHDRNFGQKFCQVSVLNFGPGKTEIWTEICRKIWDLVLFFNPNFFLHHLHSISPKPTSNRTFSYPNQLYLSLLTSSPNLDWFWGNKILNLSTHKLIYLKFLPIPY